MRCVNCANDNVPGSRFCARCGIGLETICPACGSGNTATVRFCAWCGAPQAASRPVVESGGERKQATVLFADIVDSTKLIADLDAESVIGRLQPVIAAMAEAVHRFDGTVLGTMGDGLRATFGAPRAQEGHALLACQAALAMQDAVASLPTPTTIRIGLHSGEVVAGALDTGAAVEQEAQGLTMHIGSRMEKAAEPGGILLTAECRALVGAHCETISAGLRNFKGIAAPREVFRLVGMKPAVASERFREASLGPLRGRDDEFGLLKRALLDAEQGLGSVIGIVAPAGIGKSRLCYEFTDWCRHRQVSVLEAAAHVFGRSTPLLPMLELVRSFLGISAGLDPQAASRKVEERLVELDAAFAADVALLADFLGLPATRPDSARVDPERRLKRLQDILRRIVKAVGRRPLVILFEDLHWLDDPSRVFVETIVEAVSGTHVVMVLNYRPGFACPWRALSHYRELPLTELDGAVIDQVFGDLAGSDPALQTLRVHVARQSGGNPFFAEELVRTLAQSGALVGERGHYRLAAVNWRDPVLPPTIEAAIGARVDLLSSREKWLLQIGAVVGKEFPSSLVREVAGASEREAAELFERLSELDLIQPASVAHGPGFAFRHPLIQEVTYAMQLRVRRTRLHAAIAQAMQRSPWGQLDEAASLLAYHCEAAGQAVDAASHLQRAALFVGRTNTSQALADWKKVHHLLRDQPADEASDRLRARASGRILLLGWSEGLPAEEARRYAEEALDFARRAGDGKETAVLLGAWGRILTASGAADDYVHQVQDALALTDAGRDPASVLALNTMLSQAFLHAGLLRESLAANNAAAAAIADSGTTLARDASSMIGLDVPHWQLCLRVRILVLLGRAAEAEETLARALEPGRRETYPVLEAVAHMGGVDLAWHRGDAAMARHHTDEITRHAVQSGMPYILTRSLFCRGLATALEGDFRVAADHFREALETASRLRVGTDNEAKLLAFLADAWERSGDRAQAAETANDALEVARRRTDRLAELHANLVAARALATDAGPQDRAAAGAHLARAQALIEITGAAIFAPALRQATMPLTQSKVGV